MRETPSRVSEKECRRCGHKWLPRVRKPVQCPMCKARLDRPTKAEVAKARADRAEKATETAGVVA